MRHVRSAGQVPRQLPLAQSHKLLLAGPQVRLRLRGDLLAARGFEVTALTGKPAEAAYLKTLGAAQVVAASELDTGSRPLESARWAAAVDNLAGKPLEGMLGTMAKDGVVAAIGNAAGIELNTTVMPFILRGVRLVGINSDNDLATRERLWQRLATDLKPRHLASIRRVLPFDALPGVVDDLIAGRNRGRVVLSLDG